MNEPSLLDYLKSKLQFWKRGRERIKLPAEAEVRPTLPEDASALAAPSAEAVPGRPLRVPWRTLLALALTLIAQRTFEPAQNRSPVAGLILYALGLVMLVMAYLHREWTLPELPHEQSRVDSLRVRIIPLVLAAFFSLVAFMDFSGNLFTTVNISLWAVAIACFLWGVWVKIPGVDPWWQRFWRWITRREWNLHITRWTLLVLAVVGLVIFFRVYQLVQTPSEPFSDQAEKILDVYDVSRGLTHIFFPRNTGREAIQMYLTVAVAWLFGTGLTFISLKIGTIFIGLATMPYLYLLGKEIGGRRTGLLAVLFMGIAYWPNVISRIGLRFPLYPFFVCPTFYYLIRGLRTRNRNDMVLSGLFLGMGLHGYTPFRIMPFIVVAAVGLYLLHAQSRGNRKQAIVWLVLLALMSLIIFLPLLRYWQENPDVFSYRAFTRLGDTQNPLPGPFWQILFSNLWNGLKMFNWDDGQIWVVSVMYRPALDVISGALFLVGAALVLMRYIRNRNWVDLFLLLSVPMLQLPSTLSLAYPTENPALNRAAGAAVPVFLLVALALDGLMNAIGWGFERTARVPQGEAQISPARRILSGVLQGGLVLCLVGVSAYQNFDLVFNQFSSEFTQASWNTSEMGEVIKFFGLTYGTTDSVWIVPYAYWVDTRLPGQWAGIPNRDFAIQPDQLNTTLSVAAPKLFIVDIADKDNMSKLSALYPEGVWSEFHSKTGEPGKNFMIFFVPPSHS
jgi:hypothetical protein